MIYRFAPSDLSFLWEQCRRCFWLKAKGVRRPKENLPGVFRDIDSAQKSGVTVEDLKSLGVPAVRFLEGSKVVSSVYTGANGVQLFLSGFTDRVVLLESGTLGVYDFKTSKNDKASGRYFRSMHAYQHCLENPAKGEGQEVTDLGLVVFAPTGFKMDPKTPGRASHFGVMKLEPMEIDRVKFQFEVLEALTDLVGADMPDPDPACETCNHVAEVIKYMERDVARRARIITDAIQSGPTKPKGRKDRP